MSYVPGYDNKYVQYRLMEQSFTTDTTQWQGVDEEPIYESDNVAGSGGTFKQIKSLLLGVYKYFIINRIFLIHRLFQIISDLL